MAETKEYAVAGLAIQKAELIEQLNRVPKSDSFACMLLMGKIKAAQRQIEAALAHGAPLPPPPEGTKP